MANYSSSTSILLIFLILIVFTSSTFFVSSSESKLTSESKVSSRAKDDAALFVKKTIESHPIVIFSKTYCPYCRRAKAVFKELDQLPHVIELDMRDADPRIIMNALTMITGSVTVPQVFINGEYLGGSDDTVEAYENGKLDHLLGIATDVNDDL